MANQNITDIVACLQEGGVIVIPTDTVYGLAVSPLQSAAVERLYALKQRPRHMNLPIMVAEKSQLEDLGVDITSSASKLLDSTHVPGALTLIFGFEDQPKVDWLAGREEIAVRIPNDERMLAVLRAAGPLLVTSANASGQDTPANAAEAASQLNGTPDMIIDGGAIRTIPSTIVNCRTQPAKIERIGVLSVEVIENILQSTKQV